MKPEQNTEREAEELERGEGPEELKVERIQDRILADGTAAVASFFSVLDRIETLARGLRRLFGRGGDDQSSSSDNS